MNGFADLDAVTRNAESVWGADASIRDEFCSKENYLAFCRAEAKGQTRAVGAVATAFVKPSVQTSAPTSPESLWAADVGLRAEFGGDKNAYLALRRAEIDGRVKTIAPAAAAAQINQESEAAHPVAEPTANDACSLAARQAHIRQENVGRLFAGLPELPIPQQ